MQIQHGFLHLISMMSALIAGTLLCSFPARALVTCTSAQVNNVIVPVAPEFRNINIPILSGGITVSALRDLPVGEELFVQQISRTTINQAMRYMDCISSDSTATGTFSTLSKIEFEGGPPASTTTINGRTIYETGIQGIGYSLTYGDNSSTAENLPVTKEFAVNTSVAFGGISLTGISRNLYFRLVKTGDIPAGTWTVPINIPAIITYAEPGQNMAANFNLNSDRIHISGTVNVVAGSCQTPDVYVHLGEYEITDMMQRPNWNSPWKEFNIQLINCPVMAGRHESVGSNWAGEGSSNTYVKVPDSPNLIAYRLDFINEKGFTYMGESCLKTESAPNASEGVCVEVDDPSISNGIYTNALDSAFYSWRDKAFLNQYYAGSSATSYTIPLRARYSRVRATAENGAVVPLKAGPANAAVEFTIIYE